MSPSTVNLAICLSVPILTGPLLYRVLPLLEFYHLSVKFDFLLVLVKNTFLPRIEKVKVFCLERTSKILFILVYIVPEPCDVRVWRFKRSRIGCLQNVWLIQVDVWCARHEKEGWKRPETSTARQKLTTCVGACSGIQLEQKESWQPEIGSKLEEGTKWMFRIKFHSIDWRNGCCCSCVLLQSCFAECGTAIWICQGQSASCYCRRRKSVRIHPFLPSMDKDLITNQVFFQFAGGLQRICQATERTSLRISPWTTMDYC